MRWEATTELSENVSLSHILSGPALVLHQPPWTSCSVMETLTFLLSSQTIRIPYVPFWWMDKEERECKESSWWFTFSKKKENFS